MALFDTSYYSRKLFRRESSLGPFTEGDFRNPDQDKGVLGHAKGIASFSAGLGYVYRGARGAGYYPLSKKFWMPLAKVKEMNVERIIRKQYAHLGNKVNEAYIKELIAKTTSTTPLGLRSFGEAGAHLFSRSIVEIPEFLRYLGFPKAAEKLKVIPEKILGGTVDQMLGFYKMPKSFQAGMLAKGFKPGARTLGAVGGRVATRLVLPVAAGIMALRFINKRTEDAGVPGGAAGIGTSVWTGARTTAQRALDVVGVTEGHKYLNEVLPGYLRVAGMLLGGISALKSPYVAAGQKGALKVANKFINVMFRAFAGGVGGYAIEKGISRDAKELDRIYSGEQEVPIRKGRWWDFGRTPYEGGKIDYFRPHWSALLRRKKGKMPSPEVVGYGDQDLVERPYPESVPTISAAVGGRGKRTLSWLAAGTTNVPQPDQQQKVRGVPLSASVRLGLKPIPKGRPDYIAGPYDPQVIASESVYRATEFMGLPGFILQQTFKNTTGNETIFDPARMATPAKDFGMGEGFWEKDLGGMLGANEVFRRFVPPRRKSIEYYNPVANLMGEKYPWLPGEDNFIDFKHGDPYSKIKMGYGRLPGAGYESLHQLHSKTPGEYSPVDAFMILSDIAPYSKEFSRYKGIAGSMARKGELSPEWMRKYQEKVSQREARMEEYQFHPRRFTSSDRAQRQLIESNEDIKVGGPERLIGGAWESMMHGIAGAPIPGVSWLSDKLLPFRSSLEHYKKFQVYGTESASWGNLIRDFAKPYANQIASIFDKNFIPEETKKRWDIEEYFDKLKFIKYNILSKKAQEVGDATLVNAFNKKISQTMVGVDASGEWVNVLRSLPDKEKGYFKSFITAKGSERKEILRVTPEYMQDIYKAQWDKSDSEKSNRFLGSLPGLGKAFKNKVFGQGDESDQEDLNSYFSNKYLPGPKWAGWHPDIDLDKVKLKVVKNEAMNIHDFNLWESQEREMRNEPIPFIENYDKPNPAYKNSLIRRLLLEQMTKMGLTNPRVEIEHYPASEGYVDIDFDISKDSSSRYSRQISMAV